MNMTIDHLCDEIARRGNAFERVGAHLIVSGGLDLSGLTTLPKGVALTAGSYLDLRGLTTLPKGVTLTAGSSLDLRGLTTLPEGVTLTAGGGLDLRGLTTLPKGVTLTAGSYLYLSGLTTLPEGVTLTAGGGLYLSGLLSVSQIYAGMKIRLMTIDGICTRLISSRQIGDATLHSAQYFRGSLDADPRCYVAQSGDFFAHGETPEKAIRDLRFKLASVNFDACELVAAIKRRGTVTFNDYRLLTGACESGLSEGLRARGVPPETEELPLSTVLKLCRDGYGGDVFTRLMGE